MKKKISTGTNLVERYLKENEVVKVIEKSGDQFKSVEKDIKEVGEIILDAKKYVVFTCTEDDKATGANFRIGNKEGKLFTTRPVIIDITSKTIKLSKDGTSWTKEYPIKSLNLKELKTEARLVKTDSLMVSTRSKGREITEEEMKKRLKSLGYIVEKKNK